MKLQSKNISLFIVAFLIISWIIIAISFFITKNRIIPSNSTKININTKIEKYKQENKDFTLIYENGEDMVFKSLVYLKENKYFSYLIDKISGDILSFNDLVREDKRVALEVKESYLLALKYPEFIVKTIIENSTSTGYKTYLVKDNEVVIYYYDYIYPYDYNSQIFLKINSIFY